MEILNYNIYLIINPTNGKKYVGKTSREPKKRWNYGNGFYRNKKFYNDIQKFGWNNFIKIVLYEGLDKIHAKSIEEELIKIFDSVSTGYNQSYGEGLKKLHKKPKLKKGNKKAVICITTNKIFESLAEAAKYYSIDKGHISHCCNGFLKSAGKLPDGTKLVWRFYNSLGR